MYLLRSCKESGDFSLFVFKSLLYLAIVGKRYLHALAAMTDGSKMIAFCYCVLDKAFEALVLGRNSTLKHVPFKEYE